MSALDDARAAFEANPSKETGFDLILVARQHWNNGSLTGTSFDRAIDCVREWQRQELEKANDPNNPRNLPRLLRTLVDEHLHKAQLTALKRAIVFIENTLAVHDQIRDWRAEVFRNERTPDVDEYDEIVQRMEPDYL